MRGVSTRFLSPSKTPEYLAGGRPIVSTSLRDVMRPYGALGLVDVRIRAEELAGLGAFLGLRQLALLARRQGFFAADQEPVVVAGLRADPMLDEEGAARLSRCLEPIHRQRRVVGMDVQPMVDPCRGTAETTTRVLWVFAPALPAVAPDAFTGSGRGGGACGARP